LFDVRVEDSDAGSVTFDTDGENDGGHWRALEILSAMFRMMAGVLGFNMLIISYRHALDVDRQAARLV
jgi:hypothetical protein